MESPDNVKMYNNILSSAIYCVQQFYKQFSFFRVPTSHDILFTMYFKMIQAVTRAKGVMSQRNASRHSTTTALQENVFY